MGLAVANIRFLALTRRKSSCELNISQIAMEKMQLTREMSQLTQEYNTKLKQKSVGYYDDGKFNKVTYQYLMGYGENYHTTYNGRMPLKSNPNMVLTNYKGEVVLSKQYANAILAVCPNIMDGNGNGGTFSEDNIPEILEKLCPGRTADEFREGIASFTWSGHTENMLSGQTTGSTTGDSTDVVNNMIECILAYYYPIMLAAATNGWTTEYNDRMTDNEDYVSDAIASGIFNLAEVDQEGGYREGANVTYFTMGGDLQVRSDADTREQITQWYNAEKEYINEKETWLNIRSEDLSTELEAIKTQMDSIKTYISDAIQTVYSWGGGP